MQRRKVLLIRSDVCGWADLRTILEALPEAAVVGEAAHAGQALHLAATLQPDVTISAASVDGASTAPLLIAIHAAVPTSKLYVMAARLDAAHLAQFAAAGVSLHLLWTDLERSALAHLLAAALPSDIYVASPAVAKEFLSPHHEPLGGGQGAVRLTDRERMVLRRLAEGLTEKEIAQVELVGRRTVTRIITRLEVSLDAPTLFVLGQRASQLGLLD